MKKAWNIAGRVLTILIMVFTVFVMVFTIISVNTVNKDEADIFGYKPYIVLTDSMREQFAVGDIAVSRKVDASTLKAGDIVTFRSIDPANYGEVVTHKIREATTHEGKPAYITYGTTTGADDAYPVPVDSIIGKYSFRLPKMGYFFQFLKSPAGYFTVILLPFLLLIALQAVNFFRLVRRYKNDQRAEIEAQRAAVAAERMETLRMKEELEQLRAQLMDGTPSSATKETASILPEDSRIER